MPVLAATAALVVVQRAFFPAPLGILVQGLVLGGLTAIIAFGIALVHRADRIINFAQGDLGGLPAALAVLLILIPGVPYGLAVPAGLLAGALLGALMHTLVIRRFARAPRLILTVATIFLAQVLAAAEVALPRAFGVQSVPQAFPSPFDFSFAVGGVRFSGNEVAAMAAVPMVMLGLAAFLRLTALGTAVRASAENAERAALLGVPVERVRLTVWVLAAVLSTAAVFLRAGVLGLPIGRVLGPTILLRALAAAVVGRMENLPVILGASLGLGLLEAAVIWDTGRALFVPPVLFLVVLVALLLQPPARGRAGGASRLAPGAGFGIVPAVQPVRPVPRALARLPRVRVARAMAVSGPAAAMLALPLFLSESRLNLLGLIAILAIVGVSLVVLTGWAGQVSLGQMAFAGIGAAVAGAATSSWHWDLSLALLAAGVAGAAAATAIGLPALRIPGLLFAVTTLAMAMATSSWFLNTEVMPWIPEAGDRIPRPDLFGRLAIDTETRFYYVALAGLALALLMARNLRRARTGRVLIGTRDNERAAAAFGVNAARAKLTAFAVSGFLAAFAGGLYVHHQQALGGGPFQPEESLRVFAMVVIGGLASLPGALVGAAYVQGLDYYRGAFPESVQPFVALLGTGLGGLVMLTVWPGGLGALLYAGRDRALRALARGRYAPVGTGSAGPPS